MYRLWRLISYFFCLEVFFFLMNWQTSSTVGLITIYSFRHVSCPDGCLKQTELVLLSASMDTLHVLCDGGPSILVLQKYCHVPLVMLSCTLSWLCVSGVFSNYQTKSLQCSLGCGRKGRTTQTGRCPWQLACQVPKLLLGFALLLRSCKSIRTLLTSKN